MIKTRKIILKNLNQLKFIIKKKDINDKYQYILKTILNLDYYYYKKFLYFNFDKIIILIIKKNSFSKSQRKYLNSIIRTFNDNDDFKNIRIYGKIIKI